MLKKLKLISLYLFTHAKVRFYFLIAKTYHTFNNPKVLKSVIKDNSFWNKRQLGLLDMTA